MRFFDDKKDILWETELLEDSLNTSVHSSFATAQIAYRSERISLSRKHIPYRPYHPESISPREHINQRAYHSEGISLRGHITQSEGISLRGHITQRVYHSEGGISHHSQGHTIQKGTEDTFLKGTRFWRYSLRERHAQPTLRALAFSFYSSG